MKTLMTIIVGLGLVTASPAMACGFCAGDKAASVYSFKNKKFAEVKNAHYVSVELKGAGTQEEFKASVEVLKSLEGIYSDTINSAFAQRAVSFVYRSDFSLEQIARQFASKRSGWTMKLVEQVQ